MIKLLCEFAPIINLISAIVVTAATVVLAILTAKYVRLTKTMVDEMKQTREPNISIYFECPDAYFELIIKNTGSSPAKNISVKVVQDIEWNKLYGKLKDLEDLSPIQKGISYLVPNEQLKYLVGCPKSNENKTDEGILKLRVIFQNENGMEFNRSIDIDMNQYNGVLLDSFKQPIHLLIDVIKEAERNRRNDVRTRSIDVTPKKRCPFCEEYVNRDATKCWHCHEWINGDEEPQKDEEKLQEPE